MTVYVNPKTQNIIYTLDLVAVYTRIYYGGVNTEVCSFPLMMNRAGLQRDYKEWFRECMELIVAAVMTKNHESLIAFEFHTA